MDAVSSCARMGSTMGRTCGGGSAAHAPLEAARYGGEERDGGDHEQGEARQLRRELEELVDACAG